MFSQLDTPLKHLFEIHCFYEIQDVLDGRKRNQYRLKVVSNQTLPLRGFLICPECGKILTGSASKGKAKYYSYYHCFMGCKFRYRSDAINNQFDSMLRKYIPRPGMADLYKIVIQQSWNDQAGHITDDRKGLIKQIKELEDKISYTRDLLSSRKIEPEDYREMKFDYTSKIDRLEAKLSRSYLKSTC